ncbi:MAG: hypothetical protein U9R75_08175, partial [Candidatus Thermoplasmatota archaeon]|nr:hypothetical protein [Candidatus Thermoplasmatota archaeon]
SMNADDDADSIVFGNQGFTNGPPKIMGDSLGNRFDIADIDANGELEFIAGLPLKDLPEKDGRQRNRAGLVMVYDLKDVFNDDNRIVQISNKKGIFILHGYDIEDNLGYQMIIEDVDSDGISDIFLTSPMADGPDDLRPRCGEAYIIRGKGLVINGMEITGPGAEDRNVFLGSGNISFMVPFRNTRGSANITGGKIVVDAENMDLELNFSRTDHTPNLALSYSLLSEIILVNWTDSGEDGSINITLSLNWDLAANRWLDINVELVSDASETIERTFPKAVIFRNDVRSSGDPVLYANKDPVNRPGRWFSEGEEIGIDPPDLVYKHDVKRAVKMGPFSFGLENNGIELDSILHDSKEWLTTVVENINRYDLAISVDPILDGNHKWKHGLPSTGDPSTFVISVDPSPPDSPEDLELLSSNGVADLSKDGIFEARWDAQLGMNGDPNGSGTRYYMIEYGGVHDVPTSSGGLFGTYFQDDLFLRTGLERLDTELDFLDWGLWSPEPSLIPPDHFSARWHGSFELCDEHEQYVKFIGNGMIKVFVDDEMILDWHNLLGSPRIGPFTQDESTLRSIEIYYRHGTKRAGIQMQYLDRYGAYTIMDQTMLYHPANHTSMDIKDNEDVILMVNAVDWTGKMSASTGSHGSVDDLCPVFDMSEIGPWYGNSDVELEIIITDGEPSTSAGVDLGSVKYRLKEDAGVWSDWTNGGLRFTENEKDLDGGELHVVIEPMLNVEWKGAIQLASRDILGNEGSSDAIFFGIDTEGPSILLLEPKNGSEITANNVNITMDVSDIGGSGVDMTSAEIRISSNGKKWNEWLQMRSDRTGQIKTAWIELIYLSGEVHIQFRASDN